MDKKEFIFTATSLLLMALNVYLAIKVHIVFALAASITGIFGISLPVAMLIEPKEVRERNRVVSYNTDLTDVQKVKLKKVLDHVSSEHSINYPNHSEEIAEAENLKAALKEFGFDVYLCNAAYLWEAYSRSLQAGWITGPSNIDEAKNCIVCFVDDLYGDLFNE
jgi:hypothetical protein